MPVLPSLDDIIDIRKSRYSNENKLFAIKTVLDLEALALPERAGVLMYALTKEQQIAYDHYIEEFDKLAAIEGGFINLLEKLSRRTIYLPEQKTLILNGSIVDVGSSMRAQGLLTVLFSNTENLTEPLPYLDFIDENRELLRQWDVDTVSKVKSVKSYLNRMSGKDVFPHRGNLLLNKIYAQNLTAL